MPFTVVIERVGMGLLSAGLIIFATAAGVFFKRSIARGKELDQIKAQVLAWNHRLEEQVLQRTVELEETHRQLQEAYLETVTSLVEAMTAKDTYLFGHSHNVASYAKAIAQELGFSKNRIDRLLHGCELHDLGKIAIPDSILLKQGPLTPEEFEVIKQHPVWGARILEPLTSMKDITEMVHQEHEQWDGSGYPQGLKGEKIRLEARIISVADALDAMVSDRPYRKRLALEQASSELQRCAGTQFDPQVVDACLQAIKDGKLTITAETHAQLLNKSKHHRHGPS